ncbi:MAG TPA: metal-dependent phosphohydrolase, partial [Kofleriaceae bacterium]|nr:metal-dependent phosphohydrolase [Kofleriaceae bacterium]
MDHLAEEDAKQPPLPGGVGNAIMDAFELAPSRLIGDLKRQLEGAIEKGELEARREDAYYVAYLARNNL